MAAHANNPSTGWRVGPTFLTAFESFEACGEFFGVFLSFPALEGVVIAFDGVGDVIGLAEEDEQVSRPGGTGAEGDCWYAWSTNNGQDWTAPVSLNTNPDLNAGKHWAPCIATDGLGVCPSNSS